MYKEKLFLKNKIDFKTHGGLRVNKILKNNKNNPLVSILTIVKNGQNHLEETIQSVLNQTYKNIEYIILDGNSQDSSLEIIKKYEKVIDYWATEPDNSLWDGFNKALTLAHGDLIGIINSDDVYLPNAVETIVKYYEKNKDMDFIFGSVKKHWGVLHGYKPWKIKWSWGFYTSHSTGFFIKREASKKVGLYNTQYRYHADYDYFYRMIAIHKLKGLSTKKDELIGIFRRGGFSSTIPFYERFGEEIKIRLNNKQNKILILIIFMWKFLRHLKELK